MTKTVVTDVVVVSANHLDDETIDEVMEGKDYDTINEYAESLEESVEGIIAHRLFGDADAIPIINVSTEVYEDWDEDDVPDKRV